MSEKAEKAVELFQTYNCAQSVLGACGPSEGLDPKLCLMLPAAFGGGMARQGETCGAVTGALMVIGYQECKRNAGDLGELKTRLYSRAGGVMDEFRRRFGSVNCRELTSCDLRTAEGQQQFKERRHQSELCAKLVAGAVEILEQN